MAAGVEATRRSDEWCPHSIEAEQAVLGAILVDRDGWDRVADRVANNDFYRRAHRIVFGACQTLIEAGHALDVVTVHEQVAAQGDDGAVGGLAYIGGLADACASAANAPAYADRVRQLAVRRRAIEASQTIAARARSFERGRDEEGPAAFIGDVEAALVPVVDEAQASVRGPEHARDVALRTLDRMDQAFQDPDGASRRRTGLAAVDAIVPGLEDGTYVIVAGRPSMGKTAYALGIGDYLARRQSNPEPVLFFSYEMPVEQLMERWIAQIAQIDLTRLRSGDIHDSEWPRLHRAIKVIGDSPVYIDGDANGGVSDMRARARRLKRRLGGLGAIIVDYLQYVPSWGRSENRTQEVSEMSRGLKRLGQELGVPMIVLSQLNRELEKRQNKRPLLADLRETGGIEQDADVALFVYRDEVYHEDTPDPGGAEIIVAKQRNGPTGTAHARFDGPHVRFDDAG